MRSRHYDHYDVFNAILYSLTTGCPWRELQTISLNGIQFTIIMICGETSQILRLIRY